MRFIVLILCLILVLQSCSDSSMEPEVNEFSLRALEGQIQNYNLGDSVEIRMNRIHSIRPDGDSIVVVSSGVINKDGRFFIGLAKPPDNMLQYYPVCTGIEISDNTAMVYLHSSYILYKNNFKIGYMYCSEKPLNEDSLGGSYVTGLLYSDKGFIVSGDCINGDQTKKIISKNNRHHYKGWNLIIHSIIENSDTLFITESKVDNNFTGNWFVALYD